MKLIALVMAAYLSLALESTLLPELTGSSRFGVLQWVVLPFAALMLSRPTAVVFAAIYGLAMDALGGGRLGVCLILSVLGVLALQRLSAPSALSSLGRTVALTLASSMGLSMTLFAVESLLHLRDSDALREVTPGMLVTQLLVTALVGAIVAGLVSTPWRLIGMKRTRDLV